MDTAIFSIGISQSLSNLGADTVIGLTEEEADNRLQQYGPNKLKSAKKRSLFLRVLDQFKDFLVIILIAAAIVSVLVGDGLKDAIIIVAILV